MKFKGSWSWYPSHSRISAHLSHARACLDHRGTDGATPMKITEWASYNSSLQILNGLVQKILALFEKLWVMNLREAFWSERQKFVLGHPFPSSQIFIRLFHGNSDSFSSAALRFGVTLRCKKNAWSFETFLGEPPRVPPSVVFPFSYRIDALARM